ncbi:MAG TPA: YceI family protein [Fimbriimonas sp.]|nr:YceI family protein [Fimbriimonas sp.]
MKAKYALPTLLIPIAVASTVVFHPGIAYAEPAMASLPVVDVPTAGDLVVDPMHTSVGFEIEHFGISKIQGRFNKLEGSIHADSKDLDNCKVSFTIATDSVDTNVAPRDAHLRNADFFEVSKYPTIKFESTKVRKRGNGYVAEGNLTMKAVTKKVSISFKAHGPIVSPQAGTRIGIVADPLVINRLDYGVGSGDKLPNGKFAIGDKVTIRLSVEATMKQ